MSAYAADPVFAWLQDESQQKVIRISRGGHDVPYDGAGFRACDVVSVAPTASATALPIAIASTDGFTYVLDRMSANITIPCRPEMGVAHDTVEFLKALLVKSNMRLPQKTASRGQAACHGTSDAVIPLLTSGADAPTMLVSGRQWLVMTWIGSASPFELTLDASTGTPVTHVASLEVHILRTPLPALSVGRYRLRLVDSCHGGVEEDNLEVVEASERPKMPLQLKQLPEPQRTIFYADYLIGLDDGRWGLEGLQLVGALPTTNPVAQAWIAKWSGGPP